VKRVNPRATKVGTYEITGIAEPVDVVELSSR